jgi:hypothetical protein
MQHRHKSALSLALLSPYFLPACFALYVLLRLVVVLFVPIEQYSDNLWYYERAVTLASGQGYSQGGIATAYWPPGWPGVLSLLFWFFGTSPLVAQMANLVFSTATFILTLSLGSALYANKLVGRLAALMLAIYPNQIGYVPILSTEVFYSALLLLAIFVLMGGNRLTRLVSSGFLFGFATLTKAQTLFVPAVLLAAWWLLAGERTRFVSRIGNVAVVYAALAVVILPWTVRNYIVFGEFVLISTNGGATLLTGNNPTATGDYNENDALVRQVPNDVRGQVANDRLATSMALKWIHDNPVSFLILIPRKVWRLWGPDGESEWAYQAGFKNYNHYWVIFRAIRIFNQLYYSVIMILFGLSFVHFAKRYREFPAYTATGYILVAYFTAISIIFSGQSRFHFVLMPWVAIHAAWTVIRWLREAQATDGSAVVITG